MHRVQVKFKGMNDRFYCKERMENDDIEKVMLELDLLK